MSNLSAPIDEIIERLNHSKAPGQLLAGWIVHEIPVERIDGLKDFPFVALELPQWSESYRAAKNALPTITLTLIVGTNKTKGLAAHLEHCSEVLNAIELNTATPRRPAPGLGGALLRPFEVSARENSTLDISLITKLTLTLEAKPALRGER